MPRIPVNLQKIAVNYTYIQNYLKKNPVIVESTSYNKLLYPPMASSIVNCRLTYVSLVVFP